MGGINNNLTTAIMDAIAQDAYEINIYNWLILSSTIIPFYATLLKLPQEIEHIWMRSFSLPTWLYILARYGTLAQEGVDLSTTILQFGRICDILANAGNGLSVLSSIGIQGLLVARAYSLYQGKIVTMALTFGSLSSVVILLYGIIAFPGCLKSVPTSAVILALSGNICIILTDILIFGICMWTVWGTWRLKREAGIQSTHSLVSVLVTQSILRCCFVVVFTITSEVITGFSNFSVVLRGLSQGFTLYQNVLSSTLVCDFILDLRSLNSAKIEASNVSLSSLQFSNALQRIHQSIIVEMSTPENADAVGNDDDSNFESEPMENSDSQQAQD